jgi:hypothetical protein
MPISDGKNYECAMTGEGMRVPDSDRAKRTPRFDREKFRAVPDFFACCFLLNFPVPNETPAAKFRLTDKPGMWFSAAARASGAERDAIPEACQTYQRPRIPLTRKKPPSSAQHRAVIRVTCGPCAGKRAVGVWCLRIVTRRIAR